MPGGVCSNCIAFGSVCSRAQSSKAEDSNNLSNKSRTAQEHVTYILSGSKEYLSGDPPVVYQILVAVSQYARRLEEALAATTAARSLSVPPSLGVQPFPPPYSHGETDTETDNESDDGLLVDSTLPESLQQVTRDIATNRFYGKSSNIHLIRAFLAAKMEATGDSFLINQRPEFWNVRPWELTTEIFLPQLFPEPQLLMTLIDLFFSEVNILIYVLHEITFRRAVAAGLHLHDQGFGAVVLAVCALGAKYSDDSRVFLEHSDSEHTAGWVWFRQVRVVPPSLVASPSLYEIQLILLGILYLASASTPEESWALVGLGLRMAYDLGAHSRVRANHKNNIEAELYKRVFLILLCSDVIMSSLLGRPRATQLRELDLDLPVALEGEPPIVVIYASLLIKLMDIWGRIQDAIYPVKRKDQNYQEIVAELDSALNEWVDSVPEQLRWDPNQRDLTTMNQSACLYATYYVQIILHRPFIPSPGSHVSLSSITFPSLAIAANAARSCAHVMHVQSKRARGPLYNPQIISSIFDSATVLLLNVFHNSRPSADPSVERCVDVLKAYERRWQVAGRSRDILAGMLAGTAPSTMPPSMKRPRSPEDVTSTIAVTRDIEQLQVQEIERLLFLPLHSEALGRLPVHDFDSIFHSDAFLETETGNPEPDHRFSTSLEAPFPDSRLENAALFENTWNEWSTYIANGPN
ncbi:fungal-specific transcription factor domain-containing protein [Mycena albidolilacea]|uniref:Fungal-specific transcription factor domain-containing protein n=1 Tax=Mycena albidolilacea TaxID=1033008 RepID=A0AAD7AKY6_9AGAR|nr:fungal-specific transcription factor domain-containing protein [Mycena albidolilacea]